MLFAIGAHARAARRGAQYSRCRYAFAAAIFRHVSLFDAITPAMPYYDACHAALPC